MKRAVGLTLAACLMLTSCAPGAECARPVASPPATQSGGLAPALRGAPSPEPSSLEYTADDLHELPQAPALEYEFLPAGSEWSALAAGDVPAAFSATYALADGVLTVGKEVTDSLASAGQLMAGGAAQKLLPERIIAEGGYVPRAVLDAAAQKKNRAVKNGTVVVDESSGTAFKVVSPTEFTGVFESDAELSKAVKPLGDTYAVTQPQLREVLKDFSLGGETISLTRANITGFAPNVEKNLVFPDQARYQPVAFGDAYKGFRHLSGDPLMKLEFTDERLDARVGNSPISVVVSGGLGVDKIDVTARYTMSDGYRLTMTLSQESYLVVELEAEVAQEIVIPIYGIRISVKAGDKEIARIAGGVFVIVGMDGTLKLEVDARQFSATTAGVRGSTKFYIPTSIHPVYDQHFESDGDVDLFGDIDGYLKFGPMIKLDVFGFKLVGAGAFLGVGASVQTDGSFLDVELYGLLQVYIDFLGKHLSLANFRPTILEKRQTDTAGYQVTFLEAYVYPGRVGGILKKDPPGKGQPYQVAAGVPYRILVVPAGETFDPNVPGDVDKASIRKYPASGYALTNGEGEFIQQDPEILYGGELACLELWVGGKSYFSAFVTPTLPFEKVAITEADYFNDYVRGQVQPIRVIDWDAGPGDSPYEWVYYADNLITLNPYLWSVYCYDIYKGYVPYGGQARTLTDDKGYFDTRNTLMSAVPSIPLPPQEFDVYETPSDYGYMGGFNFRLDCNDANSGDRIDCKTTSPLLFTRLVEEVPNSHEQEEEGGKLIDRMSYDEFIWIVNPHGTRTVTDEEFSYRGGVFSTQDYVAEDLYDYDLYGYPRYDHSFETENPRLTPVLDEDGNPTGASLFTQRVTVEWVWQANPNPIHITSADHTAVTTAGGSFQVTAEGLAPFAFTLIGAPQGVVMEKTLGVTTGLMTIPAGLPEGKYTFTIRAAEDRTLALYKGNPNLVYTTDKYKGNDPPPPAEQLFTLTVTRGEEPESSRPPEPRTPPVIAEEAHGYVFSKLVGGGDLTVPLSASGSAPISWSLEPKSDRHLIPKEVTLDPLTGVLTVKKGVEPGDYAFVVRAENDVGFDTQECALKVTSLVRPPRPPGLTGLSGDAVQAAPLRVPPGADGFIPMEFAQAAEAPPNAVTLRWDHGMDVYTRDRFTVNGALYVHWHAMPKVVVNGMGDKEQVFLDSAPRCDNYHHWADPLPKAVRDKLMEAVKAQNTELRQVDPLSEAGLSAQGLLAGIDNYAVNRMEDGFFYLEYGSLLGEMAAQRGGSFEVELNDRTGTLVTGKYFMGLQNNRGAQLTFRQNGAAITFRGGDVEAASAHDMLDFGYYAAALDQEQMLAAVGGEGFAFSFGHHGELPGTATFSITTDIAEGTRVNVYRYDAAADSFALIAGNVAVGEGGAVTYKNNTMSEYLITARVIEGAQVSAMAGSQGSALSGGLLAAAVLAAAGIAAALWIFLRRNQFKRAQ